MTRNSRRPVRRLTESQLRRIIRQEVRRLNEGVFELEPKAKLTIHRKQVGDALGIYVNDPPTDEEKAEAQAVFNDVVNKMRDAAAKVGLRLQTLGVSPTKPKMFIVIGDRSKVEDFAMAVDEEVFAGPQSVSDEGSALSLIVDLGMIRDA